METGGVRYFTKFPYLNAEKRFSPFSLSNRKCMKTPIQHYKVKFYRNFHTLTRKKKEKLRKPRLVFVLSQGPLRRSIQGESMQQNLRGKWHLSFDSLKFHAPF